MCMLFITLSNMNVNRLDIVIQSAISLDRWTETRHHYLHVLIYACYTALDIFTSKICCCLISFVACYRSRSIRAF